MKPRDRVFAALSLTEPDDLVPVWEIEFHLFNAFSREKLVISQDYIRLTEAGRERAMRRNAEIMVDVAKRIGLCALSNIGPYWEVAPGEPAPMWYPPEDSERFLPILRKAAGDDIFIMEWCQAMLLMPEADDYLEFAYKLFDTPKEVDQMARDKYKKGMEIARRARDAGADGLCAACDIADTKGMYFSPEQMDRFFLPYLRDWGREVAAMGMKSILHTDGNIMDALDNIADSGINGLQAIDPVAHMDIVEVKRRVGGKIALCGNIDLGLLQNGPIPAIEEEVKRICDGCKTGGGFVLGATNAVFTEIPAEHYLAMTAAGRQFGRYVR